MPRHKHLGAMEAGLPSRLFSLLTVLIGTNLMTTVGDTIGTEEPVRVGLEEGDPPSSSLFNLYIDSLAELLASTPRSVSSLPANKFADDVLCMAKTVRGLQILLDRCTRWEHKHGMTWAPEKRFVLTQDLPYMQLTLSDQPLQIVPHATYLGV